MATKKVTRKICLLGDPAVGKTSLIHRYVYDAFDERYLSTIGTKITKKTGLFDVPGTENKVEMTLMIWDISGQKKIESVHHSYYKGAKGALIVADITRSDTFHNLVRWISDLFKISPDVPIIVLANKYDLKDSATIAEDEVKKITDKLGVSFLYTSAKSGMNVENAFKGISEYLVRQFDQ